MKKSVLIFGGTRGIGRMISDHFINAGIEITIAARKAQDLLEIEQLHQNTCTKVNISLADVSNEEQVSASFSKHRETFGHHPNIVINAAAVQGPIGPTWEVSSEKWQEAIEINLIGSFYVAKEAVNAMLPQNKGSIILFSGGGSVCARPNFSAYGVSKTGVLRLVETIAEELNLLGHKNIIINAIAPGAVKTGMTKEIISAGAKAGDKDLSDAVKILESGGTPPQQIIKLIEFLSNSKVNQGLSGNLIHVREDYIDFVKKHQGEYPVDAGKLRRNPLK